MVTAQLPIVNLAVSVSARRSPETGHRAMGFQKTIYRTPGQILWRRKRMGDNPFYPTFPTRAITTSANLFPISGINSSTSQIMVLFPMITCLTRAKYDTSIDAYSATSSDEDVATVRVSGSNVTIKAESDVPSGLVIQPFIKACQITVTATSTDGTTAKQKFTVRVWWWTR